MEFDTFTAWIVARNRNYQNSTIAVWKHRRFIPDKPKQQRLLLNGHALKKSYKLLRLRYLRLCGLMYPRYTLTDHKRKHSTMTVQQWLLLTDQIRDVLALLADFANRPEPKRLLRVINDNRIKAFVLFPYSKVVIEKLQRNPKADVSIYHLCLMRSNCLEAIKRTQPLIKTLVRI